MFQPDTSTVTYPRFAVKELKCALMVLQTSSLQLITEITDFLFGQNSQTAFRAE